jgi:hypothetical protein
MQALNKMIKLILVIISTISLLAGIPLLTVSCSSSAEYIPEKMDTPLQQKLRQLETENSEYVIQFNGKADKSISDEMKLEIEKTGVLTESIIGNIFTASGNTESIKKLSMLDFVVYLELAQKMDIKK